MTTQASVSQMYCYTEETDVQWLRVPVSGERVVGRNRSPHPAIDLILIFG